MIRSKNPRYRRNFIGSAVTSMVVCLACFLLPPAVMAQPMPYRPLADPPLLDQPSPEWTCFYGSDRSNKSSETVLLGEWPDAGPEPGRTAPSASNSQEIDLYVVLAEGVYRYEAVPHRLDPVAPGDFRRRAGRRRAATAPANIFYIADLDCYDLGPDQPDRAIGDPEVQKSYYYTATGFIAQNVYLFAASQGLAAWFHNCDKENTVDEFNLRSRQKVLFAQSVEYPE